MAPFWFLILALSLIIIGTSVAWYLLKERVRPMDTVEAFAAKMDALAPFDTADDEADEKEG